MSKYAYLTDFDWIMDLVKCPCGDPQSKNQDCVCGSFEYFDQQVDLKQAAEALRILGQMFEWYDHSRQSRFRLYKALSDHFGAGVDYWESKGLVDLVFAAELMLEAKPPREVISIAQLADQYDRDTQTIYRWINQGLLPEPHLPQGKRKGKVFYRDEVPETPPA